MTDFKGFLLDSDSWILNSRLMISPEWHINTYIIEQLDQLRKLSQLFKATGIRVGLLLNFGAPKLEWNRFVF